MIDKNRGILVVRRSIHIKAAPAMIWKQFESFELMNRWWGIITGTPEAGTSNGQRLVTYEPRKGGRIEMEVSFQGSPLRYGGTIVAFKRERELTFELDWIPNRGWRKPTLMTIRLSRALKGTLVELTHHNFEATGNRASEDHAEYEAGWGMTQLKALRELVKAT
jgi:uncharacterized protein YndB with AHSA1/START domain